MERIEALISKLKEQHQQNADPSLLLGTVQLLQFELTKLQSNKSQSLGTAKVAVLLPQTNIVAAAYEKYAPKPIMAEQKVIQDVKEVIQERTQDTVVEKLTTPVVQKNGQLDMTFDPMTEIPTLSHQVKKEVNDMSGQEESLNERLRQTKTELSDTLKEAPVKDLRKAVGINDRFLFINDLFRGDEAMYERSIKTINSFNIYAEAEYWISRELKLKLGWPQDNASVQHFDQLVKRRFS